MFMPKDKPRYRSTAAIFDKLQRTSPTSTDGREVRRRLATQYHNTDPAPSAGHYYNPKGKRPVR